MSKSLGNGIDPLEVVDEYGADALKFTLTYLAAQGQDILLDKESFKLGSKFANKIWNAARYLLMNLEGRELVHRDEIETEDFDIWIYHRLNAAACTVRSAVASFRFNDAAGAVYDFFWNDFCDWYIEISKLKLYDKDDAVKDRAASRLLYVLEETLRLIHPFLSFISEEIYQKLPEAVRYPAAVTAPYPEERPEREQPAIAEHAAVLQELVRGIRTLRSEFTIPPAKKISAVIRVDADCPAAGFLKKHIDIIRELTQSSELRVTAEQPEKRGSIPVAGNGFESYVYIQDAVDVPKEIEKLKKEQGKLEQQLRKTGNKLANPQFLEKAPEAVIAKEKEIERELSGKLEKIGTYLRDLE
jgi:valyl-tRNA synthetase